MQKYVTEVPSFQNETEDIENTRQNGSVSKIAVDTGKSIKVKLCQNKNTKIILSLLQINTPSPMSVIYHCP